MGAAGWRAGDPFPEGHTLLAASGAAFSAVVISQAANAFACRSTSRRAFSSGRPRNRLLLVAVAVELAMLGGFLFIPPVASFLDHGPPTAWGWGVALLAAPCVWLADALHKRFLWRNGPGSDP
jgi:hypothetical protein